MLSFLNKYAKNIMCSQNGEEGVLLECQRRGINIFHCVEIGGHDGRFCSNTAWVIESDIRVVTGLFVESNYDRYLQCKTNWAHNPNVRSQCCYVNERNINAFVDERCDLLSLDTDGSDYRIFNGLQVRPKIVIMEIDSSLPPNDPSFNSDGAAGYFLGVELGLEKGYFLMVHTGNLIFVREEFKHLFPEVEGKHPLIDAECYFNRGWLKESAA